MLLRAYLPKLLTALFGGIFIAAGIATFGNSTLFDRIFFGVLIFTAIICHKNINVIGILLIIFIQRVMEETAWIYLADNYMVKLVLYLVSFWAVYYYFYDSASKVLLLCLVPVVLTEIYWFSISYPAPQIYWNISIVVLNLIIRDLIFFRVRYTDKFFPNKGKSTNLDWVIYKLNFTAMIIHTASISEYLIRHLLEYTHILIFYHSFPYIMHGLAVIVIWSTFNESYRQLAPRLLKA